MSDKREKRGGLGRGLSALMADIDPPNAETRPADQPRRAELFVAIERIEANPDQPRRTFAEEQLEELAASIAQRGIIQPLIVRPHPEKSDAFQIVAGERRWRASQLAKIHEVPVIVREFDDTEMLEVAIIENIQRADLNPVDEAAGYRQLMDRFGRTQEQMADALGKSRSHIANSLRLLNLPADVQGWLAEGRLTAGHARALVATEAASDLARQVIAKNLSVRQTEALVRKPDKPSKPKRSADESKDADTRALEQDLSAAMGLPITIDHKSGADTGKLTIGYKSLEQLDQICQLISRGLD
ncbi:ParB/RepB/Spo0J family partition protein [Palleronia abyssalis]|uniref:Chromosome-partitioning protein ParB n=1 Tax=Palleronia abyssalis TaxID=1501240 RepID=A0A2R8BSQ1_9RHOB|nr:ParB/RepB/Spo0J family partition protein [Palleronia abyssalis]SPJ23171.1 Chromosome-partitioning protein ParB [Palleronia abyssalis]